MLNSEVQILVPFYDKIEPETERSLRACEQKGFHVWRMPGISAIDIARIHMANAALQKGYKALFWIDADMGFDVSAVLRMVNAGHPVLTACCPMKDGTGRPCVMAHPHTNFKNEFTPVEFCGTGFLFTMADVYHEIARSLKPCRTRWSMEVPYFMPFVENETYLSEDFAFCSRAKSVGHTIMADTTVNVRHFGKVGYTWNREA